MKLLSGLRMRGPCSSRRVYHGIGLTHSMMIKSLGRSAEGTFSTEKVPSALFSLHLSSPSPPLLQHHRLGVDFDSEEHVRLFSKVLAAVEASLPV